MNPSSNHQKDQIDALLSWQKERGLHYPTYAKTSDLDQPCVSPIDSNSAESVSTETVSTETVSERNQMADESEQFIPNSKPWFTIEEGSEKSDLVIISTRSSWNEKGDSAAIEARNLLNKMIGAMKLENLSVSKVFISDEVNGGSEIQIKEEFSKLGCSVAVVLDKKTAMALKLDRSSRSYSEMRGRWIESELELRESKFIATWHPVKLLDHPMLKKDAWADLQMVMKQLNH